MNVNHLLFGAAYYDEYMPYDRIELDMALMAKAGMNVIRIAESTWSTLEPAEGCYDFTHIDRMLKAAAHHGIEVIIGTPTYAIPSWLAKKSEDMLVLSENGPALYGHRQNMDITNPIYLSYAEKIIRALLSHVRDYPNIIGFQIDNETKAYGTAGSRVQQLFVDYLKERFPDIRKFNLEFGLDYWSNRVDDWDNFPDIRGTINGSLAAEFARFQRKLVTDFFAWQASIINEYKRPAQFITQNFDFEWHDYSYGLQPEVDQPDSAKCMTVAGADIYHPSQDKLTGAEITFCGNIARGIKQSNYLILETQAQGNLTWLPYPMQLRLCAYSHIANGANSVMYWHWHSIHNAIESYWKGVLSHDFSENSTYQEACRIGSEFLQIGTKIANLTKKNRVAMILDNASLTGLTQFPIPELGSYSYNTIARWLADALYRLNIEYDIVSATQTDYSAYDVLFVPALYSASEQTLHAIEQYVAAGGTAVVTFRSGFSDEHLKIYSDTQPHILHKCLGITYNQFTSPTQNHIAFRTDSSLSTRLSDIQTGADTMSFPAKYWMELVTPTTAEVIAEYRSCPFGNYAAITKQDYEAGRAYYLGCCFDDTALDALICAIMEEAGISISTLLFPLVVKQGINHAGARILYFLNYSGARMDFTYDYPAGTSLLTGDSIASGETLSIDAWDVIIVEI